MFSKMIPKTKSDIMQAFWELYCEKRITKITIKDIVTKAGYNRSTFYAYFKDIYDVLEQFEEYLLMDIQDIVTKRKIFEDSNNVLDLISMIYSEKGMYIDVLLGEKGDPLFTTKMKDIMRPSISNLMKTQTDGCYTNYLIEWTLSGMIAIISMWYSNGQKESLEEISEMIYKVMSKSMVME